MMRSGDIVGDRFEIETRVGAGGMGEIYRARDLRSGEAIALKVLLGKSPHDLVRFALEADVLANLQMPGVVRYVAHGTTGERRPYLAMQWIDGETLAQRLARGELTVEETITFAARLASTLGEIHRRGLVHRDLKPSNLLLPGGALDRAMLIDFGIVRVAGLDAQLTQSKAVVGTPGYLAPEQARGHKQLDARADVFAFGCVLYRCLTGRPAFYGSGIALYAKVLLEDPPRVRALRRELSPRLDDLVAGMLAKNPEERPRDGTAVAAEIASLGPVSAWPPPASGDPEQELRARATQREAMTYGITAGEQVFMCLVLALAEGADVAGKVTLDRTKLDAMADSFDGALEIVDGRAPMIVLSSASVATDLAERSARCALALQSELGGAPVALVSGRAERLGARPVASLVDRASELLAAGDATRPAALRIDDVTAALLHGRFTITRDYVGHLIGSSQRPNDPLVELLGKPTPCVGRERELKLLAAEVAHCIEESVAGAALVLAPAGLGKSRLRREFLRRLGDGDQAVEIWMGRADSMSAGSAFGLIARVLAGLMDLRDDDPPAVRRDKILSRVKRHASRGIDVPHVAAFLGEITGAPFPDEQNEQLRAARRNPLLMSDQILGAWEDLLRSECSVRPVVLVLEDLQWGDLPTVNLVGAALRHPRGIPLFVLALGRPEVQTIFPRLWSGLAVHCVHLTPLPGRACERLVREALGEHVDAELIARIVARAGGNAFFLEELIRAVASGNVEELPETVMAMVQARLRALGEGERRALRAASIFGETFWRDGIAAVLGQDNVAPWLDELVVREVIERRRSAETRGEVEYRFRHALVRDAAYGMLTASDVRLGHALAGDWLEKTGRTDPLALAEHFERGGVIARAAGAYLRAAEQALRGNDLAGALARVDRALACDPDPAILGACRTVQAEVHLWRGEFALAEDRAGLALARLERGGAPWFFAATQLTRAIAKQGALDRLEALVIDEMTTTAPAPDARTARDILLAECATASILGGRYPRADAILQEIERGAGDASARESEVTARVEQARAFRITPAGDPEACLAAFEAALTAFEQAGDRRNACAARMNLGFCHAALGDFSAAQEMLQAALAEARRMDLQEVAGYCLHNLGLALAYGGELAAGRATEEAAVRAAEQLGDPRCAGAARCYVAWIALLQGDLETGEREAGLASGVVGAASPIGVLATAVRARALVGLGRADEALACAEEALSGLNSLGTIDEGESNVRLAHAEALAAAGKAREATAAILAARDILIARANKLRDPTRRDRFLNAIPDHARILELAVSASRGHLCSSTL